MKTLDQHCALCFQKPVGYVKTKGGFWKLCESCEEVIKRAGLWVEPDQIYAQAKEPSK